MSDYEPDHVVNYHDEGPPAIYPHTAFQAAETINANLDAIAAALDDLETAIEGFTSDAGFTYRRTGITGGTADDLDGIDGDSLSGGETAVVIVGDAPGQISFYTLDPDSGAAANPPLIVAPAQNPGDKRWMLSGYVVRVGTVAGTVCAGDDSRLPSSDQKAALAGTSGTPSDTNRFVADEDSRMTNARTPTSHAASHQNGGSDEIATAMPAANAIPMADGDGHLAEDWLPETLGGRTV